MLYFRSVLLTCCFFTFAEAMSELLIRTEVAGIDSALSPLLLLICRLPVFYKRSSINIMCNGFKYQNGFYLFLADI